MIIGFRTEKNATGWSKDKLRSLLEGLVLEDDKCEYDVSSLLSINYYLLLLQFSLCFYIILLSFVVQLIARTWDIIYLLHASTDLSVMACHSLDRTQANPLGLSENLIL